MNKPLIIYVSGAPGSGKTTLAKLIADEFQILRLSNDIINGGLRLTSQGQSDRKWAFDEVYIPTLVNMAQKGVSIVVDQVLQKGVSEKDVIDKISPFAEIVYIHTQSKNSIDRYIEREVNRKDRGRFKTSQESIERGEVHRNNLEKTEKPLDLGLPTLVVNTEDGYQPAVEEVFRFIETVRKDTYSS